MRRLITALVLAGLLLITAALMSPAQSTGLSQLFGRRDVPNHVICYSTSRESEHLSCVYVPPDGTQVQFPKWDRLPDPNVEPKTT